MEESARTSPADTAGPQDPLRFYGGLAGALAPFFLFLAGVGWLALSGAPDERGFWPIQLAALILGLLLARDKKRYSDTLISGMAQPIVMVMILAWLLAGVLATLMSASGFIQALVWTAQQAGVAGGGYVAVAFAICCVVSTSTGTSLGTILICGPLLYPTGAAVGADAAVLIGAILGGATFGDSISPISDTTIASAGTQFADIGGVVRSRLKYVIPAGVVACIVSAAMGGADTVGTSAAAAATNPRSLPMLLVPVFVIGLLLAGRHLVEGLLYGILGGSLLALALGVVRPSQLIYIDAARYSARGLIIDGLERGIGVSVFTLLLIALVATLQATQVLDRMVTFARRQTRTARGAEWWIFGSVSAAVMLTTHSVVAILTVGEFARETGESLGLTNYRRANLLDMTVCTYPFLLPYFIPTILAAGTTAAGVEFGLPRLSPWTAGLYNTYSWALLVVVVLAIVTGFGRKEAPRAPSGYETEVL